MPAVVHLSDWILIPQHSGEAIKVLVRLGANLSMRRGTVLGQYRGRAETYGPYDPLATDGRAVARLILEYDCATDGDGNITLASLVVDEGVLQDRKYEKVHAFVAGSFSCGDLVGLDGQAISQLGRLIGGTLSNGILRMA